MTHFGGKSWRQHIALDVGTATTRIAKGNNCVVTTPSAIGATRALACGVVVDGEAVAAILQPLLHGARAFGIVTPHVLVCAPSDANRQERDRLLDAVRTAGAASVTIIPEPLAAAIGSGLDISSPYARMVIDIGEGVTDCAVIRSGKIEATCATRLGCADMRSSILRNARSHGLSVGDSEMKAEQLMRSCGLVGSPAEAGSDLTALWLEPVVRSIAGTIESFWRDLPDELACDVIDSGICVTGGGALIPGVREYLQRRLNIALELAPDPLASVAEGARAILPVLVSLNHWH
jgi:rod shape-determining protein MreB